MWLIMRNPTVSMPSSRAVALWCAEMSASVQWVAMRTTLAPARCAALSSRTVPIPGRSLILAPHGPRNITHQEPASRVVYTTRQEKSDVRGRSRQLPMGLEANAPSPQRRAGPIAARAAGPQYRHAELNSRRFNPLPRLIEDIVSSKNLVAHAAGPRHHNNLLSRGFRESFCRGRLLTGARGGHSWPGLRVRM